MPVWASHSTFSFFVVSSLNLWGGWHIHILYIYIYISPDCHFMRPPRFGHVRSVPPPLSRWRFRPFRLHCLRGRWSDLAWLWSHTLTGPWWLGNQCAYHRRFCSFFVFSTVKSHPHWSLVTGQSVCLPYEILQFFCFLDCEVTPSLVLGDWAISVPTIRDSAVFCFLDCEVTPSLVLGDWAISVPTI